ncbi:MAG: hypothetical protein QOJ76_2016 [Acidobacteriota bacterium]|jgi:hypothetical protein|nr:hypothetical protein [Acidobacteriota bacterium]
MREQLEQRLGELRAQYEHGLKVMSELETQQATLRRTLLRISGAVEVLEEELNRSAQPAAACDDAHTQADAHTGCNDQAALNEQAPHDEHAALNGHAAAHDAAHALELTGA